LIDIDIDIDIGTEDSWIEMSDLCPVRCWEYQGYVYARYIFLNTV